MHDFVLFRKRDRSLTLTLNVLSFFNGYFCLNRRDDTFDFLFQVFAVRSEREVAGLVLGAPNDLVEPVHLEHEAIPQPHSFLCRELVAPEIELLLRRQRNPDLSEVLVHHVQSWTAPV